MLTFSLFHPFQPSFHVLYSILPKDGPIIPILLGKVRTKQKECAHKSRDGQHLLLRTNRKRTVRGAHKTRDSCILKINRFWDFFNLLHSVWKLPKMSHFWFSRQNSYFSIFLRFWKFLGFETFLTFCKVFENYQKCLIFIFLHTFMLFNILEQFYSFGIILFFWKTF